jgi:uncharacterized ferritin-like protein (DUF455 family)
MELRQTALRLLCIVDPRTKADAVRAIDPLAHPLDPQVTLLTGDQVIPGRPDRPLLVAPRKVPRRGMGSVAGRAALVHALAHIELNAINLALDAVWRFASLPQEFYLDWWQVAREEALHFCLLSDHLHTLGFAYGDFEAHDNLWLMAEKTADDVLARMGLVPRLLEARGLDAAPPIRKKLADAGDLPAAQILDIILADEIGHVDIGNRWFAWLCAQRNLDPGTAFPALLAQYQAPMPKAPFNLAARRSAGFTDSEIAWLVAQA